MSPWDVLQNLYDSGISAGLQSVWDSGLTAWIGDERSGVKAERIFRRYEFDCIATWLDQEGRRHFPNSRYSGEFGIAMNDAPDHQAVPVGILSEMRESSRKPPKRATQSGPTRSPKKDQRPKRS